MRTVSESDTIGADELRALARGRFGDMIKGVVDLRRGILLLDADMHADQEAQLLAEGSAQADLWGINIDPDAADAEWLEFDSMVNLRPSFGNRSRVVVDFFAGPNQYGSSAASLQKYLDAYAVAARRT